MIWPGLIDEDYLAFVQAKIISSGKILQPFKFAVYIMLNRCADGPVGARMPFRLKLQAVL